VTGPDEYALYRTDRPAWIAQASERSAALFATAGDERINATWDLAGDELRAAIWRLCSEATRERIRAVRHSAALAGSDGG